METYIKLLNEYVNVPAKLIAIIVVVFVVMQIVGEIMEFFGKIAPSFMKVRKWRESKKAEAKAQSDLVKESLAFIKANESLFKEVQQRYSSENISKRDVWMESVNKGLSESKNCYESLAKKLDKNNEVTLSLLIEGKRNIILGFAARAVESDCLLSHQEFRRIFRIYDEYESIIKENHIQNGEVDVAMDIIKEAYQERVKTHKFIEDTRGIQG